MVLGGKDVMGEPLSVRRELLAEHVLVKLAEPIRESPVLEASLSDLIASVKAHGLEGLVAKRRDSRYELGQRSGAWQKMRVNQEPGTRDSPGIRSAPGTLTRSCSATRRRQAAVRRAHPQRIHSGIARPTLQAIPGSGSGGMPVREPAGAEGWTMGRGAECDKMPECRWLRPVLVGQFEFVEWTQDGHLRHSRYVGLRDDKKPLDVVREAGTTRHGLDFQSDDRRSLRHLRVGSILAEIGRAIKLKWR